MGEIADDCYDRAMEEYADMSDGEKMDFELGWAHQKQLLERRAQWRRNQRQDSDSSDEPPF